MGLVIAMFALNMNVSAEDSNVVNLNLLSLRHNYLIVGGIIFIAGIILVTKFQRNKSDEKELVNNGKLSKVNASKTSILSQYWYEKSFGEKIILISIVAALCSLTLDWRVISIGQLDISRGSKASVENMIILVAIWFYPIFMTIRKMPIHLYKGLFVGFLSLVWIVSLINHSNALNMELNGTDSKSITFLTGDGMYSVAAASVLFLTGILITAWNKSKKVIV